MEDFLNIKEVAKRLQVSTSTVERWIRSGVMPPCYQIDIRTPRLWDPKDIEALITKSRRA